MFFPIWLALPVSVPFHHSLLKEYRLHPCKGATLEVFDKEHCFSWTTHGRKKVVKEKLPYAEITLSWGIVALTDFAPLKMGLDAHLDEQYYRFHSEKPCHPYDPFLGKNFFMSDAFGVFFRDENEGVLGGAFGFMFPNKSMQIQCFFIEKAMRLKGLGRKMVGYLEKLGKNMSFKSIEVPTSSWEAPDFYEKVGFTKIKSQQINNNFTVYEFEKRL